MVEKKYRENYVLSEKGAGGRAPYVVPFVCLFVVVNGEQLAKGGGLK